MCDIKKEPQTEKKSQSRLTLPSIGIIIFVVSVFVLAVAAFIVHLFSPRIIWIKSDIKRIYSC